MEKSIESGKLTLQNIEFNPRLKQKVHFFVFNKLTVASREPTAAC